MGVLPAMLEEALRRPAEADAVLNFGYDWLPLWLTPWVTAPLFHDQHGVCLRCDATGD